MATIDELHAQSVGQDTQGLSGKLVGLLRGVAEAVAPMANSPGAAGIAGIRSLLPGHGTFAQELDRYNRAATPSPLYSDDSRFGSIVKDPAKPWVPTQGAQERDKAMAIQAVMAGALKRYDLRGNPIPVDPNTGKARGWTEKELRERQARFDASMARARAEEVRDGPFRGSAVRNMGTGEVKEGGPIAHHKIELPQGHSFERYGDWIEQFGPNERTPDLSKIWEAGFVTKDGKFVARKEATSMIRNGETDLSLHASDADTGFRPQFLDEMERTQRPVVPSVEAEAAKQLRGPRLTEQRRDILFDRKPPANEPIRDLRGWEKGPLEYWRPRETEMVPVSELEKYREFDRAGHGANVDSPENISALGDTLSAYGATNPVMIQYYQNGKSAVLGEGNHRLATAKAAGIEELPARVWRVEHKPYYRADDPITGRRASRPVPGAPENEFGYVPANLKPSQIGIPSRPLTPEEAALNGKKIRIGYPKDYLTDAQTREMADWQFSDLAGEMRDAEWAARQPKPEPLDASLQALIDKLRW